MILLFTLVALPVLFFMLVWVAVTAYRLFRPAQPYPLEQEPFFVRQQAQGETVSIGAREIREDQRRARRREAYHYTEGDSDGFPLHWHSDLWLRRN